jgi:hypothetical protein
MSTESRVRYAIDVENKISFVDEGWCRFAEANHAEELMPPAILGQSLWDHITDATTRTLYQQVVARVRQGKSAVFTLRCDGPSCRRLLEMTVRASSDGSVEFETRARWVEDREPVALLSQKMTRSTDVVRMCAWCNRVDVGFGSNDWVEVEDATERLQLFEFERMPWLTHAICEACLASMTDTLANL